MSTYAVFEAVLLVSIGLASALFLCVSRQTLQAGDALTIHVLMGSFLSSLLYFYVPMDYAARYWLASSSIPFTYWVTRYLVGPVVWSSLTSSTLRSDHQYGSMDTGGQVKRQ